MFGLSEEMYNVVKKQAKACNDEIKKFVDAGTKSNRAARYDQIAPVAIDKHRAPVATEIGKLQFVWLCGYLAGRYGKKGEYE